MKRLVLFPKRAFLFLSFYRYGSVYLGHSCRHLSKNASQIWDAFLYLYAFYISTTIYAQKLCSTQYEHASLLRLIACFLGGFFCIFSNIIFIFFIVFAVIFFRRCVSVVLHIRRIKLLVVLYEGKSCFLTIGRE